MKKGSGFVSNPTLPTDKGGAESEEPLLDPGAGKGVTNMNRPKNPEEREWFDERGASFIGQH